MRKICAVLISAVLSTTLLFAVGASAAPSNQTISFSARLKNSSGSVVPDGYYNIQFKLYTQESGGSAIWTETYHDANGAAAGQDNRVQIKNGYLSVKLGSLQDFSGVDWSSSIWLTMNVGGTAQEATIASINWDGEMSPRIQMSAVPYAINANMLGGKSADEFLQVGNGIVDSSSEDSITINKTGTGHLMNLQSSGDSVFKLLSTGSITMGSANDQTISIADSSSGSGKSLTLAAGNATSGNNSGGDLVLAAGSGSGTGSDGTIVMGSSVSVGAGNTITMVGGATSMRPADPSEGTIYFDTDTKELLLYADGKWQALNQNGGAKSSTATKVVAASDSPSEIKDGADYIADGTGDQEEINDALDALSSTGGSVYLAEGTYNLSEPIVISKNGTTLQGSGSGTLIKRMYNGSASNDGLITLMANDVSIKSVKIDGNKSTYTSTNNNGVAVSSMRNRIEISDSNISNNGGNGVAALWNTLGGAGYGKDWRVDNNVISGNNQDGLSLNRIGATITRNTIKNNSAKGISELWCGGESDSPVITSNRVIDNANDGIFVNCYGAIVNNNFINNNGNVGVWASGSNIVISGNIFNSNQRSISTGASDINISSNFIADSSDTGIFIQSSNVNIRGNTIQNSSGAAIYVNGLHNNIDVSDNVMREFGANFGIPVVGTGWRVVNNNIIRTSGSGYAITVYSTADEAFLSENTFSGSGANGINDQGTGTIYSNQRDASGKIINKSSGGFGVKDNSGSDAMSIDSSTGTVNIAGSLDTTTATALNIGTGNATEIKLNQNTTVKPVSNSSATFQVQNSTGAQLLAVDSQNNRVVIGAGSTDGTVLVLGKRTTSSDPAGTDGAMYYNSNLGKFRCYQDGGWVDCVTPLPVMVTLEENAPSGYNAEDVGLEFDLAPNTKYHYRFILKHASPDGAATSEFGTDFTNAPESNTWCVSTTERVDNSNPAAHITIPGYCGSGDVASYLDTYGGSIYLATSIMEGYVETGSSATTLKLRSAANTMSWNEIEAGSYGILQVVQD